MMSANAKGGSPIPRYLAAFLHENLPMLPSDPIQPSAFAVGILWNKIHGSGNEERAPYCHLCHDTAVRPHVDCRAVQISARARISFQAPPGMPGHSDGESVEGIVPSEGPYLIVPDHSAAACRPSRPLAFTNSTLQDG